MAWHEMDEMDEPYSVQRRPKEDAIEFEGCVCLSEARSGKAILVRGIPGKNEEWVPVSQLAEGNEVRYDGDSGTLKVTAWIVKEKGWI